MFKPDFYVNIKNFFECSVGEHSKVYYCFREQRKGVRAHEPR